MFNKRMDERTGKKVFPWWLRGRRFVQPSRSSGQVSHLARFEWRPAMQAPVWLPTGSRRFIFSPRSDHAALIRAAGPRQLAVSHTDSTRCTSRASPHEAFGCCRPTFDSYWCPFHANNCILWLPELNWIRFYAGKCDSLTVDQ